MSRRIRGQEVDIRVTVDGVLQEGTFTKIQDFTETPRTDITEEDFLGEPQTDLDIQHHGFDISFGGQVEDQRAIDFFSDVVSREEQQLPHPDITITVIYAFREGDSENRVKVYQEVFLKIAEDAFSGRKEYATTTFEGKCKKRPVLAA